MNKVDTTCTDVFISKDNKSLVEITASIKNAAVGKQYYRYLIGNQRKLKSKDGFIDLDKYDQIKRKVTFRTKSGKEWTEEKLFLVERIEIDLTDNDYCTKCRNFKSACVCNYGDDHYPDDYCPNCQESPCMCSDRDDY